MRKFEAYSRVCTTRSVCGVRAEHIHDALAVSVVRWNTRYPEVRMYWADLARRWPAHRQLEATGFGAVT